MNAEVERAFAAAGPLASKVPGYRPRPQQLEMAQAIADAIESNGVLVAEAGTGTGKTFAYLVPALLGGGKVIISTGTKTLQDQLFDRDLPAVRAALATGASGFALRIHCSASWSRTSWPVPFLTTSEEMKPFAPMTMRTSTVPSQLLSIATRG